MLSFSRNNPPPINVHVDIHNEGLESKIDRILCLLERLKEQGVRMDAAMQRLEASVSGIRTVADSAATLIAGIAQQLRDIVAGGPTPATIAKINAFSDSLDQEKAELSQAIIENTPTPPG